jgi:hypothetical protein
MSQMTKNIKIPDARKTHLMAFWAMGTVPAPRYFELGIWLLREKKEKWIRKTFFSFFFRLLGVIPRC